MKTIELNESAYNKLLTELGYGNDDLSNLAHELDMNLSDAMQVVRDHVIMCNRLGQEPNEYVLKIEQHLNAINDLLNNIKKI